MSHAHEIKALRERRFTSTEQAQAAIPAWLKDRSTHKPSSMDNLMRETRYVCKPAILFNAGWVVCDYVIRTRSEEYQRDKWRDYVEVWVGTDYAMSYTWADAIRAEVAAGNIQLAPELQQELDAMPVEA